VWRHTHLFEPIGSSQTLYQDRIEFAIGCNGALNRLAARRALARAHARVRESSSNRARGCLLRASEERASMGCRNRRCRSGDAAAASARAQMLAVRTVPFRRSDRYAGEWFETRAVREPVSATVCGDVRASYTRRADGRIDVVNRCRTGDGQTEARGVARLVDEQTHAKLKVRFAPAWLSWLPPVWGDYWIIGLAPDYSWAVVGDPGREYLWILARTPRLDAESMAAARAVAQDNGFNVRRLVQTPHEAGRR
jgi:apolipoprotein D and lipocalin family protein